MPEYLHPGVYVEEYAGRRHVDSRGVDLRPHVIDRALADELLAAARRAHPDWTDINQSDPGVALLGLVEWLSWIAARPGAAVPERGRGAARRAAAILAALAERCAPSRDAPSRLNFFAGQRLDAESLRAEQEYFRGKLRRHNRELHGWGIVRGLGVIVEASANDPGGRVRVEPGYALDPRGNEIIVRDEVRLGPAEGPPVSLRLRSTLGSPVRTGPIAGRSADRDPHRGGLHRGRGRRWDRSVDRHRTAAPYRRTMGCRSRVLAAPDGSPA